MVLALEERRLRPIVHALEQRQYGPALKELNAYLKKSPKSTLANAWKCYALELSGEHDEALKTYEHLLAIQSSDPLAPIVEEKAPAPTASPAEETPEGEDGAADAGADSATGQVIKVKQPAKKPKGKGKSSKGRPKPAANGGGTTAASKAAAAAAEAASRDEIYSGVVLSVLARFLKGQNRMDDIATLYTKAWRYHPDEIGFGVQSFFYAGVRAGDWVQTRQIAQHLYQVTGDTKTLSWAAFAAYQQAVEVDPSEPGAPALRSALLSMSLSIMWSYPADPYQDIETFLLFIRVLRAAGRHAEALRRMTPGCKASRDSEDSARFDSWQEPVIAARRVQNKGQPDVDAEEVWQEALLNRAKAEDGFVRKWASDLRFQWERWETVEEVARLVGAGKVDGNGEANGKANSAVEWDWPQESVRAEDVIIGAEDVPNTNYKAYLSFITCLFVLLRQQHTSKAASNGTDQRDYLQDARTTLLDLAERFGSKERAPILALLEINLRLSQTAAAGQDLSATADEKTDSFKLIRRYWDAFGDKGCLFDDLKPYWHLLDRSALEEDLQSRADEFDPSTPAGVIRSINALKVTRHILYEQAGPWNNAQELAKRYDAARKALGKYPETDLHPADDLRLLQAHVEITSAHTAKAQAQSQDDLITALSSVCVSLEDLLKDSPSNGPTRILLIRLYRQLGCVNLLQTHIEALKMRWFQHETVLHIFTERVAVFYAGADPNTETFMRDMLQLGQAVPITTCNELNEGLVDAFSHQSYSQIHGMLELLQAVRESFQTAVGDLEFMRSIAVVDAERMLLSFRNAEAMASGAATRPFEDKQDTRDWSLLCDFGPDNNDRSIKTLTSTGPITRLAWLNSMRLAWMLVITMNGAEDMDPEPHIQRLENLDAATQALLTEPELALLRYAATLCRWMHDLRRGVCTSAVTPPSLNLVSKPDDLPWVDMQELEVQLEAFAMLEIITMGMREKAQASVEHPKGFKHVLASLTAGRRQLSRAAARGQELARGPIPDDPEDPTTEPAKTANEAFQHMIEARRSAFTELVNCCARSATRNHAS